MKRFNKVVEDILIGKYGIAWNVDGYYIIYRHFLSDDRKKVSYGIKFNTQVKLFDLLGILEYEYLYISVKMRNCNCFSLCFNCYKNKDVQYALTEAKNIVVCEIERIQKGG